MNDVSSHSALLLATHLMSFVGKRRLPRVTLCSTSTLKFILSLVGFITMGKRGVRLVHMGAAGCICLLPVEVRRQLPKCSAGVSLAQLVASLLLTWDEVWRSYSQQLAFGTEPRLRIQSSKYTQ